MPKITRATQKIFGDTAGAVNNFGIFGSLAAGTPLNSKDLDQIQSLPAWLQGLAGAVVGNKSPAFEDVNSLFYTAFKQLAYLFQQGLAEWDADTVYYIGSQCQVAGVDYQSLTNDNAGNNPTTDTNNWVRKSVLYDQQRYPVGELYLTRRDGNPSTLLGFGTWSRIGAGKFAVARNPSDGDFATIGQQGGSKTAQITGENLPSYGNAHADGNAPGGALLTTPGGDGTPLPILNPYEVLFNAWIRET